MGKLYTSTQNSLLTPSLSLSLILTLLMLSRLMPAEAKQGRVCERNAVVATGRQAGRQAGGAMSAQLDSAKLLQMFDRLHALLVGIVATNIA